MTDREIAEKALAEIWRLYGREPRTGPPEHAQWNDGYDTGWNKAIFCAATTLQLAFSPKLNRLDKEAPK